MVNYSQVFADTLAEFESPFVPGDQGDAGKGQVTVRAGYKICTTMDPDIGYIAKSPGQTQFNGVSVDALKDKSDGTWADFLTDELQPDGRRLIKLAYTPGDPPAAGSDPRAGWVQPTEAYCDYPGPLVLKSPAPGPDPEPEPEPGPADDEILDRLDEINQTLIAMQTQQSDDTIAILARSDENTEKIQSQINQIVNDAEETLKEVLVLILLNRPPNASRGATQATEEADALVKATDVVDRLRARRAARSSVTT